LAIGSDPDECIGDEFITVRCCGNAAGQRQVEAIVTSFSPAYFYYFFRGFFFAEEYELIHRLNFPKVSLERALVQPVSLQFFPQQVSLILLAERRSLF